ncbi:caspase family protein [Azospirillum agricola]|uniref:caspase family protein n=1 Tax=Azospirillum agricola TaxID=1720247 RepID=UPI000A0F3B4F|nr:caspase family protein [Azospirillum agricola]SMH31800.1 Uncharacterized protein, contains caspase domain [Azospirillum lipoferum]
MGRLAIAVMAMLMAVSVAVAPAMAEDRVALVVGIDRYASLAPLSNPANDARTVAETLRGLGFRLIGGKAQIDPDRARLLDLLDDLGQASQGALAVAYFAGHGARHGNLNYLIPSDDQRIRYREQLRDWAVSVDQVLAELKGAATAVVLLDACRNTPLPSKEGGRSGDRGLARLERAPLQSLVMFAAQPGSVAKDGIGSNGPFALALKEQLPTPGLEIGLMMRRVRDRVAALTKDEQTPEIVVNLGGREVYLAGAGQSPLPPPPPPPPPVTDRAAKASSGPSTGRTAATVDRSAFLFPDSSVRHLGDDELKPLSKWDLRVARNEIFARNGRYFKDPELQRHFSQFSWYKPTRWDPPLSPIEEANVRRIQRVEETRP